jgi:hypothetical protein
MVLNRQGPGHHPLGDALYLNLDMVLNEQGSGHRILIFRSNKMLDEWRWSILIPIFKNKGDVQSCTNYRGIKLISHTIKL